MTSASGCVVVDTNVLAVAEGLHEGASEACLAACIALAREIEGGLPVAVDSGDEILNEYFGTLRHSKRSGLGKKLALHLYRQRGNTDICHKVDVHALDAPPGSFQEVPVGLRDFDVDDQKFIAVAAAEPCRPQIHTAVDGEWWDRRQDFVAAGIDVQFACPGDLRGRT
jgi:hypothetical protein